MEKEMKRIRKRECEEMRRRRIKGRENVKKKNKQKSEIVIS